MASNWFGSTFRVTTFGESRGKGVGCVIDGCPAGLPVCEEDFAKDLQRRAPGGRGCSRRSEPDRVEILSGVYEGKTTGAPIALWIVNCDVKNDLCGVFRPGHADWVYTKKYGHVDVRGGGRASARETAARVAAGVVAKRVIEREGMGVRAWVSQAGERVFTVEEQHLLEGYLEEVRGAKDSVGGIVSGEISGAPCGLGDPIYEKLSALLGFAMLSIPACRGFEFGAGFSVAMMKGSVHTDPMDEQGRFLSNNTGGILGGISTGEPILFRVAFKPTSSIGISIPTVGKDGKKTSYTTENLSRNDPCVAVRAVPVVEAMAAIVMVNAFLNSR